MAEAFGYAVKTPAGEIDVRTVSPTIRAAQVNGLHLAGFLILNDHTDEVISRAWGDFARRTGHSLVMLDIRERTYADA